MCLKQGRGQNEKIFAIPFEKRFPTESDSQFCDLLCQSDLQ